ncbi:MAG TPA: methyl-accepting chemotaxis protein, partial [Alcanivorax sp.]|nr:methyl-accepting chemotaxis protein [Alcanivorax sp.]HBT06356.1 methyl-accepting chemotaxis protein [Alcanivorax sp.]
MNRLNNMTVKTSWSLVLLAFSVIILLIGGLSIYTSHQSRQSFETLNQTHVERAGALQRTYINLLQAQVAMDRAAELVRVPSFDEPGPVLDQAAAFIEQAQRHFENFLAMSGEGAAMQAVVPLSDAMDRLTDVGLRLQLVLLREGDFAGYRSGRSRLNGMSQDFINAADAFLADSRAAANALVSRFDRRVQRLDAAMVAAVLAA